MFHIPLVFSYMAANQAMATAMAGPLTAVKFFFPTKPVERVKRPYTPR